MREIAILIPKNKDLKTLLIDSSNEYDTEYLKYLIHYVIDGLSKIIENKKVKNYQTLKKKYIGLHSTNDVFISYDKHKRHMRLLISNEIDIVERRSRTTHLDKTISVFYRRNAIEGVRPFGFRLNPRFFGKELEVHYLKHYRLINTIREKHSSIIPIVNSGKYMFLKKYFNPDKLKIDIEKSIELCNLRFSEHKSYSKYLNEMVKITNIFNGIYKIYHKKDTDARIHSNLTRLPKPYRKYLTYNESRLIEVDLSNSVIYFLSMLLINKIDFKLLNNPPLLLTLSKTLECVDITEIELIQRKAVNGIFYEDFMSEFKKKYSDNDLKDKYERENDGSYNGTFKHIRKVVKKSIFTMMFAKTDTYETEQEIFKSKYPSILKAINKFKDEQGYKKISHVLLQLEADFVLDKAGRSFNKDYWRKAPLFTLHDCLITTEEYGGKLKDVMESVFTELIGISPKMEEEKW